MYHTRFKGTHYEIGHKYGSSLLKYGKFILKNVPFEISEEMLVFASECLPYYKEYYPEIVEEMQGLADGQQCEFDQIAGVLFSMYCIVPAAHCSCFAARKPGGAVFGRNSDFLTCIERLYENSIYQFSGTQFSFMGNTTAFIELEDGVNEHGLAVGLTSVFPTVLRPGLNAGMMLRLILERCRNIREAITLLEHLPVASSQTFVLADAGGEIALLEFNAEEQEIICMSKSDAYVCATNLFHTDKMRKYNAPDIDNWKAEERYQTLIRGLEGKSQTMTIDTAMDLLAGKEGFVCQYDRKTGKDTVWSLSTIPVQKGFSE